MKKKAMRRAAKKEVQKKLTENVRMERKPIRSGTRMEGEGGGSVKGVQEWHEEDKNGENEDINERRRRSGRRR